MRKINTDKLHFTIKDLGTILKRADLSSKKQYEKVEKDKILAILGNGKSLGENIFNRDSNVDYMVVNRHVLDESYEQIKPLYYVMADPFFFRHEDGKKILRLINEKTSWKMTFFSPYDKSMVHVLKDLFTNGNITVKFYNGREFRGHIRIAYWLYEHCLCMPRVQNVLVASIMLGLYFDYQRIELYGVEHDWLKNLYVGDDNLVYLLNKHFYDKKEVLPKPQKDIQKRREYPLGDNLMDYAMMFKSYWQIKKYVERKGLKNKIVNKTRGSYIDAFERDFKD